MSISIFKIFHFLLLPFQTYENSDIDMKFYRIENKQMPWGDYGNSLLTGSLEDKNGIIKLARTGPYIPPIIDVHLNDWVITDDFKKEMESSELKGFSFQKVELSKIVKIDWKQWDLNSEEPLFYPDSGEPEDYIHDGPNDPQLFANSGKFWKLTFVNSVQVEMREGAEWWQKIPVILANSWPKSNFATSDQIRYVFIDQTAKEWLEQRVDGNLEFIEVDTK